MMIIALLIMVVSVDETFMEKCEKYIPLLKNKPHVHLAGSCGCAYTMIKWKLKTTWNMLAFQSVPDAINKFIGIKDSVKFSNIKVLYTL
jgi:protein tyrosine phosphatase